MNGHSKQLKCTFCKDATQLIKNSLLTTIREELEKENWDLSTYVQTIGDRKFKDYRLFETFKYLQVVEVDIIWLDFNKHPQIIRQIIPPNYSQLKKLFLGDNNISTAEPLTKLKAPTLEYIYLNNNFIVSLRPIRKMYMPNLKVISLNGNPLIDQEWMTQMFFNKIDKIYMGYKTNKNCKVMVQNWYAKAQIQMYTEISTPNSPEQKFTKYKYLAELKRKSKVIKNQKKIQQKNYKK